jgi:hypothetical protein
MSEAIATTATTLTRVKPTMAPRRSALRRRRRAILDEGPRDGVGELRHWNGVPLVTTTLGVILVIALMLWVIARAGHFSSHRRPPGP